VPEREVKNNRFAVANPGDSKIVTGNVSDFCRRAVEQLASYLLLYIGDIMTVYTCGGKWEADIYETLTSGSSEGCNLLCERRPF
jgi:hypothetical protein